MNRSTEPSIAERLAALLRESRAEPKLELLDKHSFPRVYEKTERSKRGGITRARQLAVFARDHFIDRYTGERLLFPGTLRLLGELYPDAFPKAAADAGWRVGRCHWVYWRLWPTVDHRVPIAKGGHATSMDNLVTTSQMTNSAKGAWTDEAAPAHMRVSLIDLATVQRESWDGLMPWFVWMLDMHPPLRGRDKSMDLWWTVAKKFLNKKGIVPDGDIVWNMKDFD